MTTKAERFERYAALLAVALPLAAGACSRDEAGRAAAPTGAAAPAEAARQEARPSERPAGPTLHAHTASEDGFLVGSYAVVDGGEILVIDTQVIRPEVEAFIELLRGLDGTVTTIFVTHAHPDHYLGLQWLTAAFPEARVVATPETVELMAQGGEATLAFMKSEAYFGGALAPVLPDRVVIPQAHEGSTIRVGATELEILTYPEAESKSGHALYHAASGSLFTGDLAYNHVHAWLKDTPPARWIAALEDMKRRPVKRVFPGHGEPGGPEILDRTLAYLRDFEAAVASSRSRAQLVSKVVQQHPDERLPIIVEIAAPTYFAK